MATTLAGAATFLRALLLVGLTLAVVPAAVVALVEATRGANLAIETAGQLVETSTEVKSADNAATLPPGAMTTAVLHSTETITSARTLI
ncbi:hypothetical protein H9L05_07170 [Hymenobacter qilianensis]|uniref:Uncharacterized protein n=1 Tax=Hymenobacter qilianensis TaxID=1385715 RepID=A0A7H0GYK8_9BACT|nr:hypothetical protein [Hymenobacter qilianensis]QNP53374.1 hypothetical protein H9L05_07170 [Hymenobacter qilianensis]